MLQEPTTKLLLRAKVSRAGLNSPSLPHCGAGWAHGEEPESRGLGKFPTGVWRMSKGTAAGLSGSCLMEIFPGLLCLHGWDMVKKLRGAQLQLLGTGRWRMGNDGTTWKSFCRPPQQRGCPMSNISKAAASLCCGPGQQIPNVLVAVEWRKTPAGTSPRANRDRRSMSQWRPHEPMVAGGNWVSLRRSQGALTPRSPGRRCSRVGEKRDETFPGHWKNIKKPQQEGRWS